MSPRTADAISDLSGMWAALDKAKEQHCGKIVARPANSFTVKEFAARYGYSERNALMHLTAMENKGALSKVRSYVPDGNGRLMLTNCYTVKA